MMDVLSYTPQKWVEDEENLLNRLQDPEVWNKIPLLNVNELELKDQSLVRFRGMIQDMLNPEYYLEKFEIINASTKEGTLRNGKYCDGATCNDNESVHLESNQNITSERHTFVVISVPGLNEWVTDIEKEKYEFPETNSALKKECKRTYEDMETEEVEQPKPSSSLNNKPNGQFTSHTQTDISKEFISNFPLCDRTGKASILKVYQNSADLKLNSVYEFVGFLSVNDDASTERLPATFSMPSIHCISFKELEHNNPLLTKDDDKLDNRRIKFIRDELKLLLTQLLLGDDLAAEYLLCHLISEVYVRRECMPLGKFSLNISHIPMIEELNFVKEIYEFIQSIVTKSHYLPMSLHHLNTCTFIPKKDYDRDRLSSGVLQLSKNTYLILDEIQLGTGKLTSVGLNNVKAITAAIRDQKVAYDFNYYTLEYECDIPFLIFSEGKSMIKCDTQVALKPARVEDSFTDTINAIKAYLKPEPLNDIRKYFTQVKFIKYDISQNMEEMIQNRFVDMRQRHTTTAEDLHTLLVLARLLCISEGKDTLDEECWNKACELEENRKARLLG